MTFRFQTFSGHFSTFILTDEYQHLSLSPTGAVTGAAVNAPFRFGVPGGGSYNILTTSCLPTQGQDKPPHLFRSYFLPLGKVLQFPSRILHTAWLNF